MVRQLLAERLSVTVFFHINHLIKISNFNMSSLEIVILPRLAAC